MELESVWSQSLVVRVSREDLVLLRAAVGGMINGDEADEFETLVGASLEEAVSLAGTLDELDAAFGRHLAINHASPPQSQAIIRLERDTAVIRFGWSELLILDYSLKRLQYGVASNVITTTGTSKADPKRASEFTSDLIRRLRVLAN